MPEIARKSSAKRQKKSEGEAAQKNKRPSAPRRSRAKSGARDKQTPRRSRTKSGARDKQTPGPSTTKSGARDKQKPGRPPSKSWARDKQRVSTKSEVGAEEVQTENEQESIIEPPAKIEPSLTKASKMLLEGTIKRCFVCNSTGPYYKGRYLCEECWQKFDTIVYRAGNVLCPRLGKCAHQKCDFCTGELFYQSGIEATDITTFKFGVREFRPVVKTTLILPLNEEEEALVKQYANSFAHVLNWIWKQGDLLKLNPADRMKLMKNNIGRARMMWITAAMTPRHDVIKSDEGYISFLKFTSESTREVVISMSNITMYFRTLGLTSRHFYFLKLLSFFQIDKAATCTYQQFPHLDSHEVEEYKEPNEINLLVEASRRMLKEMGISDEDMKMLTDFIDKLACLGSILAKQQSDAVDTEVLLFEWTENKSDWEKRSADNIPPMSKFYTPERLEMCHFLNKMFLKVLGYAKDFLTPHISIRDQNTLLLYNMAPVTVGAICWTCDDLTYTPAEGKKEDEKVQSFYTQAKTIQDNIKKGLSKYLTFPDYFIASILRQASHVHIKLKDVEISELITEARNEAIDNIKGVLKDRYADNADQQAGVLRNIEKAWEWVENACEKTAGALDLAGRSLPLCVNIKYWLLEPH